MSGIFWRNYRLGLGSKQFDCIGKIGNRNIDIVLLFVYQIVRHCLKLGKSLNKNVPRHFGIVVLIVVCLLHFVFKPIVCGVVCGGKFHIGNKCGFVKPQSAVTLAGFDIFVLLYKYHYRFFDKLAYIVNKFDSFHPLRFLNFRPTVVHGSVTVYIKLGGKVMLCTVFCNKSQTIVHIECIAVRTDVNNKILVVTNSNLIHQHRISQNNITVTSFGGLASNKLQ